MSISGHSEGATFPIPYHDTWDVIDPSKMNTYLECPRKFFWEYILGWREDKLNNHLHFGKAWHLGMEHLLRHGFGEQSIYDAYEAFLTFYRTEVHETDDEVYTPKNPERALIAYVKYANKYADDLDKFEVLFLETAGTVPITSEDVLHFRMDSILREKDGAQRIVSLEHKTGSNKYRWEEQWPLSLQGWCYSHALHCMYPYEPAQKGIIFNAAFFMKTKSITDKCIDFMRVPMYREMWSMNVGLWNAVRILEQIKEDYRLLSQCNESDPYLGAFTMNTTNCTKYFGCPYHDLCSYYQNPLRNCAEPELGFIVERWDPREDEGKDVNKVELEMVGGG